MPTIQEEKPAKARARNRKAERRSSKSGQPQIEKPQIEVRVEADPVSAMMEQAETAVVKAEAVVVDTPVVPSEQTVETALSGEVLPPEARAPAFEGDRLQAIAQAYGEYARNSWLNGRFLAERLIAVRSFNEAIEIQDEFAKRAYANFLTQSERVCVLYGEWAQQFFRPLVWRH